MFKPGQKVRCVNAKGFYASTNTDAKLEEGAIYTVVRMNGDGDPRVYIEGFPGRTLLPSRFKAVKESRRNLPDWF